MKKIFFITILLLFFCAILISAIKKITGITRTHVSEISPVEFILEYTVSNTYEVDLYSDIQITIPFEKQIIQGKIRNNVLSEKDILFSQTDIDLNGDNDYDDSFPVQVYKNSVSINNLILSPVIRKSANYMILYPFIKENYNINKITDKGTAFTLRDYTPDSGTITIGLWNNKNIEFLKFKNNLILIEVVSSHISPERKILIDDATPFEGTTNEIAVSGGEKCRRFIIAKNISIKNGTGKDQARIKNITRPFNIRLTYYFGISENLISMTYKIIEVR